jgi:hypothetical protein
MRQTESIKRKRLAKSDGSPVSEWNLQCRNGTESCLGTIPNTGSGACSERHARCLVAFPGLKRSRDGRSPFGDGP